VKVSWGGKYPLFEFDMRLSASPSTLADVRFDLTRDPLDLEVEPLLITAGKLE
jgi:hypothetical protein